MKIPSSLYHLSRRRPDLVVAAVFLWAPTWLIGGLLSGERRVILITAAIAAAPFALALFAPFVVGFAHGPPKEKIAITVFLFFVVLLGIATGFGSTLEY